MSFHRKAGAGAVAKLTKKARAKHLFSVLGWIGLLAIVLGALLQMLATPRLRR